MGVFAGIIFIVLGFLFILGSVFGFSVPVVKILFGGFIVYLGFKIIFSGFSRGDFLFHWSDKDGKENVSVFQSKKWVTKPLFKEYQVVFGEAELDLSEVEVGEESREITINAVFSSVDITIPPKMPVELELNTVMGSLKNKSDESKKKSNKMYLVGNEIVTSSNWDQNKPHLKLEVNSVFSSIELNNAKLEL